ncbi:hypothetical protein ACG873_02035 [Mesorhizobium sp. AaZ16]|uniref:hypothetical protein n=1 Tax=Mesorhizobium sp. AaZ16 TaxID=3402289 RepID=UPI00374F63B9
MMKSQDVVVLLKLVSLEDDEHIGHQPARHTRDGVLSADEIRAFWKWLDDGRG